MAWVRIDDSFADHPKVASVGPLGMAFQVAALCYCNKYLTDGYLPASVSLRLCYLEGLAEPEEVIDRLVDAGMWEEVEGGYVIHDYHEYQPTKAKVDAAIAQRREAGSRGGKAKSKRGAKQNASESLSETSGKTEAKVCPVPNPVPNKDIPPRAIELPEDISVQTETLVMLYQEFNPVSGANSTSHTSKRRKEIHAALMAGCRYDVVERMIRENAAAGMPPWEIRRLSCIECDIGSPGRGGRSSRAPSRGKAWSEMTPEEQAALARGDEIGNDQSTMGRLA